jgi:hypothetical protein
MMNRMHDTRYKIHDSRPPLAVEELRGLPFNTHPILCLISCIVNHASGNIEMKLGG